MSTLLCPYCGHEGPAVSRYCASCGTSMDPVTPKESTGLLWWNLSYRARFYRVVWLLPFSAIVLLFDWGVKGVVLFVLLLVIGMMQAYDSYSKWKSGK